jgi:hypothetical protein
VAPGRRRALRRSEGNPLYVEELLEADEGLSGDR